MQIYEERMKVGKKKENRTTKRKKGEDVEHKK
jgi:hypothetical protein